MNWPHIVNHAGGYPEAGQERRSVSSKRRREDSDIEGGLPIQTIQRKPKNVTYMGGVRLQWMVQTAEAAPETFLLVIPTLGILLRLLR